MGKHCKKIRKPKSDEIVLRPYQKKAVEDIWAFFRQNETGDPCIVAPTGSGKSIILAELAKQAIKKYPGTRILLATHQMELIKQDVDKLKADGVDVSIFSAGLGVKEIGQVTCASIQSIYRHVDELGIINMVIIDEAHLINHNDNGMYRNLIKALRQKRPRMRVVGLTATPYRMNHGLITDKPAIFTTLINTASIQDLQEMGYLCSLTCKSTDIEFDLSAVKKVGGEFCESDLQKAVDKQLTNEEVVEEICKRAISRNHWLVFCTGVNHAHHLRDLIREHQVTCECVTGDTPKEDRIRILEDFKAGRIRALTNANVLTTGFDAPCIDMIAMVRPTMSPGLHSQMLGRGLRMSEGKENCLVLDFADNIMRHGLVTDEYSPKRHIRRRRKDPESVPYKECPECNEILPLAKKVCDMCGYEFPSRTITYPYHLYQEIDKSVPIEEMSLDYWFWQIAISKQNNKMLVLTMGSRGGRKIKCYFVLWIKSPHKAALLQLESLLSLIDGEHLSLYDILHANEIEVLNNLNSMDPIKGIKIQIGKNQQGFDTVIGYSQDVVKEPYARKISV